MAPYTIVISDDAEHDAGFRSTRLYWSLAKRLGAYAELWLYWFLTTYFGGPAVRLMTPSQLLSGPLLTTDWLFVGLPTTLNKAHLVRIRFKRLKRL